MKLPRMFLNRIVCKSGLPIHIVWFMTARCNLRCSHCFYHAQVSSKTDELSFDEIKKTVEQLSPMLSVSLTGGEPFMRDDLVEIARLFSQRKLTNNISLFTNGLDTGSIVEKTKKIALACQNTTISLGVSIDGSEREHDAFRNKKGSYRSAIATLTELKKIAQHCSNIRVGIGITLHSGNQHFVLTLRDDLYRQFGIQPGITLIRGNAKVPQLKNVDAGLYKKAIDTIEHDKMISREKGFLQAIIETREILGQRLAYETYTTQSRRYDCYGGSLMGIIYENGDVYPCEMLENAKLGNLRDVDYAIKKIWNSEKAQATRNFIKSRKCFCTYECQYTCNTLYNSVLLPLFVTTMAKKMFTHV